MILELAVLLAQTQSGDVRDVVLTSAGKIVRTGPRQEGGYAPDWAIAFRKGSVRPVFFVAETKGTMDTMEISGVEKAKIACAERLFDEASTSDVRYHQVADYDDLLQWVGRLE